MKKRARRRVLLRTGRGGRPVVAPDYFETTRTISRHLFE
jgi:hypothetical protein